MKTTFQKMTAAFGILAIALFLAVTASAQCGSYDQPKLKHQSWLTNGQSGLLKLIDRPDDDDGIVGFWRVTLTSKGNTGLGIPDGAQLDHGFAQWHSDGTEIIDDGEGGAGADVERRGGRSHAERGTTRGGVVQPILDG